jgi:hypothetical protein
MTSKATFSMPGTELRRSDETAEANASRATARGPQAVSESKTVVSNAFTIDVEDYYHVSALASAIPRDTWNERESRVSASTDRLLAMLDEKRIKGTFFVLGWVADRVPQLAKRIASVTRTN